MGVIVRMVDRYTFVFLNECHKEDTGDNTKGITLTDYYFSDISTEPPSTATAQCRTT